MPPARPQRQAEPTASIGKQSSSGRLGKQSHAQRREERGERREERGALLVLSTPSYTFCYSEKQGERETRQQTRERQREREREREACREEALIQLQHTHTHTHTHLEEALIELLVQPEKHVARKVPIEDILVVCSKLGTVSVLN